MNAPPSGDYYRLTPDEIVLGRPFGLHPPEPLPSASRSPRAVLEELIRAALREPPCYVGFSGGRDSSAVLAVATAVARRDGLPDPIPFTERYPRAPESDESQWQELTVRHLGLADWLRIEFGSDNDLLGPTAQDGLRRRGLVWPPTVQIKPNVLGRFAGSSVLTGEGGDEALGAGRIAPLTRLLHREVPIGRAALRAAVKAVAPARLRARHGLSFEDAAALLPWLRPDARAEYVRRTNADEAARPLHWGRGVWAIRRERLIREGQRNYLSVAAESGVRLVQPFADPAFQAALARSGGAVGYGSRTALMRELFADVLPPAVIERTTKAWFNQAHFADWTRAFAGEWDGSGLDPALDPEVLRAEWLSPSPSALSGVALQAAWLAHRRG